MTFNFFNEIFQLFQQVIVNRLQNEPLYLELGPITDGESAILIGDTTKSMWMRGLLLFITFNNKQRQFIFIKCVFFLSLSFC